MSELLTDEELRAMDLTADLMGSIRKVIYTEDHDPAIAEDDCTEVINHIHALQHIILSQAASRAYPHRFRPLGRRAMVEE